jgi:hypothetical protein
MASKRERILEHIAAEHGEQKIKLLMHELIIPWEMQEPLKVELRRMMAKGEKELVLPAGVRIRHRPAIGHNDR